MFGYTIIKKDELQRLQQYLSVTRDSLAEVQSRSKNYVKRIEDLSSENEELRTELLKLKKQKVELLTDVATEPLKEETKVKKTIRKTTKKSGTSQRRKVIHKETNE